MNFHQIIYNSCRDLIDLSDKINIASVFLYCQQKSRKTYADLLYCENINAFFEKLRVDFEKEDSNFANELKKENKLIYLDYNRIDIYEAILKTRNSIIQKLDSGYLRALHENDPFALQICKIVNDISRNEINDIIKDATNCT